MTIAEQITHEVESLSTKQQREALRLIRSMRAPKSRKNSKCEPMKFSELFRPLAGLKIKRSRDK